MIRFSNGVPTYIWYSQHANGEAFKYSILRKSGLRVRRVHYTTSPLSLTVS